MIPVKRERNHMIVPLRDQRSDIKVSERSLADELGEDEEILLPYSVRGFVLRSRKWRTFNIDDIKDVRVSSGFDDLVLPRGHEDTVEALVNRHSRGTKTVDIRTEANTSIDLVTGKGKGLIIFCMARQELVKLQLPSAWPRRLNGHCSPSHVVT